MSRLSGGRLASQPTNLFEFQVCIIGWNDHILFPARPSCIWILTRYLEILRRCTYLPSWLYFFPFVAVLCTHFWMAVRFLHALFRGFFRSCLALEICSGAQCSYAAIAQDTNRSMTTSYVSTCWGKFSPLIVSGEVSENSSYMPKIQTDNN